MNRRALDPLALRGGFASFPSGVVALCATIEGQRQGMALSSFTSVSLDPPLVSVCVAQTSRTWQVLRHATRLGVSVLGENQDAVCRTLAQKTGDRFTGVTGVERDSGALLVGRAALWLECSIESEIPAGDHDIVVLRIHRIDAYPTVRPLIFHGSRYRQLRVEGLRVERAAS